MQTIALRGSESITTILSLLEEVTASDVLLFVPKGCESLERNEVNMRLLRRWADNLALRLALVVQDRATQVLAREAGFVLFSSVAAGESANFAALDRRRRRRRGLPSPPTPSLLFTPNPDADRRPLLGGLPRAAAGVLSAGVAFVAFALVLVFLVPSATVVLRPRGEPIQAAMEMTGVAGQTEVSYSEALVPAQTVSIEQEGRDAIPTTNRRDVPDGHAQGSVVFANTTTIPVTITKGTVVRTSFGENLRFFTVADAWLTGDPYAGVRVGVLAANPGPAGNVAALTINTVEGDLATQVEVLNNEPTTGGSVRRISTVDGVDKVNLRVKLVKRLQEEAYAELTAGLGPDDFVPPDSLVIQVLDEIFDYRIDDITDELGLQMRVQVSGLVVSGEGGKSLMLGLLQQRTRSGYRLLEESVEYERPSLLEATPDEARFTLSARGSIVPSVDQGEVSTAIAGKDVGWAKGYLSGQFDLSAEPEIELTGALLQRLPWWTTRTTLRVVTD